MGQTVTGSACKSTYILVTETSGFRIEPHELFERHLSILCCAIFSTSVDIFKCQRYNVAHSEYQRLGTGKPYDGRESQMVISAAQTRLESHMKLFFRVRLRQQTLTSTSHPELSQKLSEESKRSPRLRSILRVAIVFEEPPSIIRVSRILELSVDEVCAVLKLVFSYLTSESSIDSPSPESLISPFQFKEHLLQLENSTFIALCHNWVARWCLTGNHADDIRDQVYANENWDYHVCKAEPSRDLYDAMENSWLPEDTLLSHDKLPGVISWLEDSEECQQDSDCRLEEEQAGL
ncbi:hypothetical protein R3P38DRAFT_3508069 [Favolaschia claudopus]|uniref:Uncharacterized protein n=1 Tax=Favolaschia claudopus TaxID=2862362 RepID=A0AAW0BY50_9AGAR